MKIRARVKAPERIPDWVKCCEAGISNIAEHSGKIFVVEPETFYESASCRCRFCNKRTLSPGAYAPSPGCYVALLDLDEGPMEAQ